jgi:cytochrome c peroxidase
MMKCDLKQLFLPAIMLFCLSFVLLTGFTPGAGVKTKAALGKLLFEEKMLSLDSSVSCASCHKPEFAFADTSAFSKGIYGRFTKRNTPSVLNMLNRSSFFWDGRAKTLEQQALMPISNKDEMGLPIPEAIKRLNAHPVYKKLFLRIFKQKPDARNLAAALSAYERTLETVDSKFDDWSNDDTTNWTAAEERGRLLFVGKKAKCFNCHFMEDFTDDGFKNIGLYDNRNFTDAGRYEITRNTKDRGTFKTPGLRNIAVTAPYMHNGQMNTLEEVLEFYNDPKKHIPDAINTDTDLQTPLQLTGQEMADIISFLKTLTDKRFIKPK